MERRRPKPGKPSQQAAEIADFAEAVLSRRFPNADWIHQVGTMVAGSIDRAIQQLSAGSVTVNAKPIGHGGEYIMPARTAQEIRETPAADDAVVSAADVAEEVSVRDPMQQPQPQFHQPAASTAGDELWL